MGASINPVQSASGKWVRNHAMLVLLASCSLFFQGWAPLFFILVFAHFMALIIRNSDQWLRTGTHVVANSITACRLVILVFIGLNWSEYDVMTLAALFWLAAILDVVDGWVAKTFGGASEFGAVFDEDVDAFFVLICSYVIWQLDLGMWWIMGAGWVRYLVVLIKAYWPPDPGRNTHFSWAKMIAGLVFILFPLCLVMMGQMSYWLQLVTFSLLLYSFLRELIFAYVYQNDLRDLPR